MAKLRSPNYPAIALGEAVQRVNLLWKKERRTAVPAEVAAKAIGYSGISGPSRTVLAALKKYGLVESDDQSVRVSELAISILHSPGDDTALEFFREAALRPELFRQLYMHYRDASDEAIRSYLIAKLSFSDSGAEQAIKTFRATLATAKLDNTGYNPPDISKEDSMETIQNKAIDKFRSAEMMAHEKSLSNIGSAETSQTFSWPLSPDVKAEVKITGGELKPEYFDALQQYLNLAKSFVVTFAVGDTVEFEDAYTHEIKYGRIERIYGNNTIIRTIAKEEAGPNPKRFSPKPDPRIAALTDGTGVIKN